MVIGLDKRRTESPGAIVIGLLSQSNPNCNTYQFSLLCSAIFAQKKFTCRMSFPSSVRSGIFVVRASTNDQAPSGRHTPCTAIWPSLFIFMSLLTELKIQFGFVATKISLLRSFHFAALQFSKTARRFSEASEGDSSQKLACYQRNCFKLVNEAWQSSAEPAGLGRTAARIFPS